ncbi:MAG: HEAT repeat domain-containing protein [Parachlamydiaceae bacterium]|nr:HEAT repeat domain-containing protein [Parachlamydiaceae bacterium]
MTRILLIGLLMLLVFPLLAAAASPTLSCPKHALYLVHKGQIDSALDLYQTHFKTCQTHDTEFLQQLGLSLLEQGAHSRDPETQLMALFGAGLATNERVLPILIRAINSPLPQLQLIALNLLAHCQHDDANKAIFQGLRSNSLLVRLEALHQIALRKDCKASNHIESLMGKVNPELLPLFPQLFALVDDNESVKMLRKLLSHTQEAVRIETVISCARSGRDDLLPKIKVLAAHGSFAQKEACALALGALRDDSSLPFLLKLSRTTTISTVKLAACKSLYILGHLEALKTIQTLAAQGDLFGIAMLGDLPENKEILAKLLTSPDFSIRLNASIALLNQQDVRCLTLLPEILVKDSRDLAFTKTLSQGKGLICWKPVFSARQQFVDSPTDLELSLNFRESLLIAAADLPEEDFLFLIKLIFDKQQNDLVPTAIALLESIETPKAIDLLRIYRQRPGAPLIRNYCNLALYRLGDEGPYSESLSAWLEQQIAVGLIQLRPLVPWELNDDQMAHQITPHETSRLLVETFEALTTKQDKHGINCLLEAIKNGNSKNKYALAGLLIRATL